MNVIPLKVVSDNTIPLQVVSDNAITLGMEKARVIYINERPVYTGEYTVTPRIETQVLHTKALRMADDVIVREIPVTRTSNIYDGITVLIG